MEINDEERRKIAARLREPKDSLLAYPDDELIRLRREVGCRYGQDLYEHLADLIDRPTTHIDVDEHGRAYCTNCGCVDWCLSEDSPYCPNCGRKVIE